MPPNNRKTDAVILQCLDHIKETTDRIEGNVAELREDNKNQWVKLNEHAVKLTAVETKVEERTISNVSEVSHKFNYKNLKYIIPYFLLLISGIVAIIMKYKSAPMP
jgi:hypothetical protein